MQATKNLLNMPTARKKKRRPGPKAEHDPAMIGPTSKVTLGICKALVKGNPLATAAWLNGKSPNTVNDWLKRGCRANDNGDKDPLEKKFAAFYRAIQVANAEADERDMQVVDDNLDWRAHAWKLTHRHPNRYAKHVEHRGKITQQHEGTVKHAVGHVLIGGVKFELGELTLEQKRKLLADYRAQKAKMEEPKQLEYGLKEDPESKSNGDDSDAEQWQAGAGDDVQRGPAGEA